MENNRASFGSNFGFLMAAIGSAVGLGNIWGFPYKMGMSGGFAFLLVYLVLAVFVGLAVMVGEFTIGRKTGLSPVAAYRKLSKKFTWLTGIPTKNLITSGTETGGVPMYADGILYLPITQFGQDAAIYQVNPETGVATKGISIKGVTEIRTLGKLNR